LIISKRPEAVFFSRMNTAGIYNPTRDTGLAFMPVVLSLIGQHAVDSGTLSRKEAREWLANAAAWFEGIGDVVLDAQLGRDADERPILLVTLHPICPAVEIRIGRSGKVRLTATTTPAGPGYHQYLCNLLNYFAKEFHLTWIADDCTDPTDYFSTHNRAATEAYFLKSLAAECATKPRQIGLPSHLLYRYPADVLTPIGPRSHDWARDVAANPQLGKEFFAWWSPEVDASFYRNRALSRMWCHFPWRPPLCEAEGELTDQIANDLTTAFKLDPSAELPWFEWLELLATIEADAKGEQLCVTPTNPLLSVELWKRTGPVPSLPPEHRIGYRRHLVRTCLDAGWSIEVPGDFAQEWDRERNWTAWNANRTVWFRRVGFTKPDGSQPTSLELLELGLRSLPEGEHLPKLEVDDAHGTAVFGPTEEDGRTIWRLSGMAGATGHLVVCNIYCQSRDDRDWAIQTWQSLRHCPPSAEPTSGSLK
jgi:hypothetical protein